VINANDRMMQGSSFRGVSNVNSHVCYDQGKLNTDGGFVEDTIQYITPLVYLSV
jgi:hypothetical protein